MFKITYKRKQATVDDFAFRKDIFVGPTDRQAQNTVQLIKKKHVLPKSTGMMSGMISGGPAWPPPAEGFIAPLSAIYEL